jgi:YVTN family beta-propeller protein
MPSRRSLYPISVALGALLTGGLVAAQEPAGPALPAATHGPVRIAFTPDGARALIAEGDTGTLAVLDTATGTLQRRIETGGAGPEGVTADTPQTAVVANAFSGSVTRLDLETGRVLASLPLRGEPSQVVLSRDHRRAFVSVAQLDEVAVLDLPALTVRTRIAVGSRPRALVLTPDGHSLLVANFRGGDVSVVDAETLRETGRVPTQGVNLRGIDVAPDGAHAYVTGQVPAGNRVTWVARDVWVNSVFRVTLPSHGAGSTAQGRIDFTGAPAPDPDGIVALDNERVALTVSGRDEALLVRATPAGDEYLSPVVEHRAAVGAHPRGVALTPDRKQLWVANELGNSISILDTASLAPIRRIDLDVPAQPDPALRGRYLFGNAGMTAGGQFTCNSCHPQGGVDGLTWQFVHVPDGVPVRNSRNLRGGVARTAPFRWSGRETEIEPFIQDEVVGLMNGRTPEPAKLQALHAMLDRLPMPASPYRAEDGSLTPAAARGKALFEGKAGCISCHKGDMHGGTGLKASVGTTASDAPLDVPHLAGVFDTAPYLHAGRAKTLEEIFQRHNPDHKHGKAHELSAAELADVLRYVREL